MAALDKDAIRKRCNEASPAPWMVRECAAACGCCDVVVSKKVKHVRSEREILKQCYDLRDSYFIAHAREDIPALLKEIERLEKELAEHRTI